MKKEQHWHWQLMAFVGRHRQMPSLFVCLLLSRIDVVVEEMVRVPKIDDGGDGKEQIKFCDPHKLTAQQRQYIGKRLHMLLKINMARHRHKTRTKRGTVGFERKIWNRIPIRKDGKTFYMLPYTVLSPYAILDRINTPAKQLYYRNDDYIAIVNDKGCHSVIGRHSGKNLLTLQVTEATPKDSAPAQQQNASGDAENGNAHKTTAVPKAPPRETCMKRRIVMHELLHILGLHHEHQRRDRSEYIDIDMNNVKKGKERNFRVEMDQESWGLPFDFESIMNYRYNQFAANARDSMVIKVRNGTTFCQATFGTHRHVSEMDFLMVNMLYNCDGVHKMVDAFIRRNLRGLRRHHRSKKRKKLEQRLEKQQQQQRRRRGGG